jgi:hypothetical protein
MVARGEARGGFCARRGGRFRWRLVGVKLGVSWRLEIGFWFGDTVSCVDVRCGSTVNVLWVVKISCATRRSSRKFGGAHSVNLFVAGRPLAPVAPFPEIRRVYRLSHGRAEHVPWTRAARCFRIRVAAR